MVLTAAQTQAFFTQPNQMGIQPATLAQLNIEGINTVDDLAEFNKDSIEQLAANLRRPAGGGPPLPFGIRSQQRLEVACNAVRYYETTGRALTVGNVAWNNVLKNFGIQWKALVDKKSDDPPDVPKITKQLPIMKWTEAFKDFLSRVIGARTIPLSYIVREDDDVPDPAPPLAQHQPHSTQHGSVEEELIARASHTHALYRVDNASVYHFLEEATRSTVYAASIKTFQRQKDGRGAWEALVSQYAGQDKWEAEIREKDLILLMLMTQ